jgi:hypothetical protein
MIDPRDKLNQYKHQLNSLLLWVVNQKKNVLLIIKI